MAAWDLNWTLPFLLGGISCVALVAVHFLRVHPLEKRVATILFWDHFGQSSIARIWLGRFRRWLVFVFLLAICLILSLSTRKNWSDNRVANVIVIDTGYSMSAHDGNGKTRLANAIGQADAELNHLSDAILVSAGPEPRLLSDFGESAVITSSRIRQLAPHDQPSNYVSALSLAGSLLPLDGGKIFWFTDRHAIPAEIANSTAGRIRLIHVGEASPNATILAAVFEPAENDPTHGDLHVRVGASEMLATAVTIRNVASGATMSQKVPGDGVTDVYFRRFSADGSTWEIQVADTLGPAADNLVKFQLPYNPPLRISFEGSIPMPLRVAMQAIGKEADLGHANVVVSDSATTAPSNIACAIRVVSEGGTSVAAGAPLSIEPGDSIFAGLSLENAHSGFGAEVVKQHLAPLILAGSKCVAGETTEGGTVTLFLSNALLSPESELPQRAAFPSILQRACNSMMRSENATVCMDARRNVDDPTWSDEHSSGRAQGIFYSMAETNVNPSGSDDAPVDAGKLIEIRARVYPVSEILMLCGIALLMVEAVLFAKSKIV